MLLFTTFLEHPPSMLIRSSRYRSHQLLQRNPLSIWKKIYILWILPLQTTPCPSLSACLLVSHCGYIVYIWIQCLAFLAYYFSVHQTWTLPKCSFSIFCQLKPLSLFGQFQHFFNSKFFTFVLGISFWISCKGWYFQGI